MSFNTIPSEQQNCGNCYYARPSKPGIDPTYVPLWMGVDQTYESSQKPKPGEHTCRVSPPVAGRQPWPEVSETDWCSYWAMAEPKREPG